MFEENEIIGFHERLTQEVLRLKDGKPNLRDIQYFALLIARSALRQQSGELTIREELALVGV